MLFPSPSQIPGKIIGFTSLPYIFKAASLNYLVESIL